MDEVEKAVERYEKKEDADADKKKQMRKDLEEIKERVEKVKENPKDYREHAPKITEAAKRLQKAGKDERNRKFKGEGKEAFERHRAGWKLEDEAKALAGKTDKNLDEIDPEEMNDTSSAFEPGTYFLQVATEGKATLLVDGKEVLSVDGNDRNVRREASEPIKLTESGVVNLNLRYSEYYGPAVVRLQWRRAESSADAFESIPADLLRYEDRAGLLGTYFPSRDHTGEPKTRLDESVDFNWGKGEPMSGIKRDQFSVEWSGQLVFPKIEPPSVDPDPETETDEELAAKLDEAEQLEEEIARIIEDTTAADVALRTGSDFEETKQAISQPLPEREDIASQIRGEDAAEGGEESTEGGEESADGGESSTEAGGDANSAHSGGEAASTGDEESGESGEKGGEEGGEDKAAGGSAGGAQSQSKGGQQGQDEGGQKKEGEGKEGGESGSDSGASSQGGSSSQSQGGESGQDSSESGESGQSSDTQSGQAGQSRQGGAAGSGDSVAAVNEHEELLRRGREQIDARAGNVRRMVDAAAGRSGADSLAAQALRRRMAASGGLASFTAGSSSETGAPSAGNDDPYGADQGDQAMLGDNMNWAGTGNTHDGKPQFELPEKLVQANSLPGRMVTDETLRGGWLYLDTWYIVGPWQWRLGDLFGTVHGPEINPGTIDFDAEFRDGKFAGQPGHPKQVMEWQFHQSDQIRVGPPDGAYGGSDYYAYTEVFSDKARTMLIAVAVDDAAKLWLNGELIWEDPAMSPYRMGEAMREIRLQPGTNTIMMRIINGPGQCFWSVLLCPPEVRELAVPVGR